MTTKIQNPKKNYLPKNVVKITTHRIKQIKDT